MSVYNYNDIFKIPLSKTNNYSDQNQNEINISNFIKKQNQTVKKDK